MNYLEIIYGCFKKRHRRSTSGDDKSSFMLKNQAFKFAAVVAILLSSMDFVSGGVIVYANAPLPQAAEFSVKAAGREIAVYDAGTFRCAPFAFSDAITVEVTYRAGEIHSFQVNPLSKGIVARQNGNTLSFTLTQPEKLEIQINGASSQVVDGNKLLYLFADAPETDAPKPDDPSVIYFGPGYHNVPDGLLRIDDSDPHSAMYVAPGAVLNAALDIARKTPFKLFGRGFIQNPATPAEKKLRRAPGAIDLRGCAGLVVEDVVFFNSVQHGITFSGGHDNTVRNVKTLHYVVNSDGIAFLGNALRNVVEDSFIVGNDNLIVIGGTRDNKGMAENKVRSCTFVKSGYAGNWGFPQGDGPIGPGNVIADCDVIRCNGEVGLIRMFWAKPTTVDHLTFENIRVQSLDGYASNPDKTNLNRFISLESGGLEYERTIIFKDIHLPSAQTSFIAPGKWEITFDHVYIADRAARSDADLKLIKGEGVVTKYIY